MSRLELIFIFVLQFEAGIRGELVLYNIPGHDVTLSCGKESDTTCSNIYWFFDRESSPGLTDVKEGKVQSSARADRLRLGSDCSLVINNITAEDAGRYSCRKGKNAGRDMITQLYVLTISPSPPDADPEKEGEVRLECSLSTYWDISNCPHCCQQKIIRWVDERGTVLHGEGVGNKPLGQSACDSFLDVKRQRGNNRRYTCQFIDKDNNVKAETDYPPVIKYDKRIDKPGKSNSDQTYIIIGAVVGLVVLMLVITVVLIKYRKRAEVTEGAQKPTNQQSDEPENNLTYITVDHSNQQPSPRRKAKEEEVTYSTVKTK